jgi:hypothetical protein
VYPKFSLSNKLIGPKPALMCILYSPAFKGRAINKRYEWALAQPKIWKHLCEPNPAAGKKLFRNLVKNILW